MAVLFAHGLASAATTSEGGLPPRVGEIIRSQISDYFGQVDLRGLPLLDPAVDWNCLTNWPDQFSFQGQTYLLRMEDWSQRDYTTSLASKVLEPAHLPALATYECGSNTTLKGVRAMPFAYWRTAIRPFEKAVQDEGLRMVFGLQYYTNGSLFEFRWTHRATGTKRTRVFDVEGTEVGNSTTAAGGHQPESCEWNGVRVAPHEYARLSSALYIQGGVPKHSTVQPVGPANSHPRTP